MYKLLTEEQKKKVSREYALRRVVIILWAVIAITVVGMVGLFPSYILSEARQKEISERLKIIGDLGLSEEDKELQAWLSDFNLKQKTLNPKGDKDNASDLIEAAVRAKSAGIRFSALEWKKGEDSEALLNISGTARDRQALVVFEQSLNASGYFGAVSLPISNLARDKDIGFQVKLTRNKQND